MINPESVKRWCIEAKAEITRLTAELEAVTAENRRLRGLGDAVLAGRVSERRSIGMAVVAVAPLDALASALAPPGARQQESTDV